MNSETAQNLTTLAVVGLSAVLAYIAISETRYRVFGREALLASSAFIFFQAVIRTLSINNIITPDTARLLVGVSAFVALVVLSQIAWLRHLDNKLRKE